jgi:signal transduction histidine kinase
MTFTSKCIATSALFILLGIGVLSFRSTLREQESREWVTHTHLVIAKLQDILIDITQAEAGQRGYILTGDEKYLKPFDDGVTRLQADTEGFRSLASDNPRQEEALQRLDALIQARLAALRERIEIRRRYGLEAGAKAVEFGNNGEYLMNGIRERISEMRQTEERLLGQRLGAAAASSRRMRTIIIFGNTVAILILSLAGFVIHRETNKRNLAEQDLRHANQGLERRTLELSETNHELESFSYSVAHDLRAPLRQIAGYSNVLSRHHAPVLNAEARRYLNKIDEGALKMGRLVDDLLSLSRVGRQQLDFQTTPLSSLLRQVVEDLAPECLERNVEWRIGDLFTAECDPGLMKQVFVNLLSNAVKYTRKRENAVIEVGYTRQAGLCVIFIRDNGVGFEMQYVGKLFGVFQRLHKARDFEGTGVGLAITQRIIRKHGGRIWAEAELDKGATFFFTLGLPATSAQEPKPTINHEVTNGARS